jgi:hypothetical protein
MKLGRSYLRVTIAFTKMDLTDTNNLIQNFVTDLKRGRRDSRIEPSTNIVFSKSEKDELLTCSCGYRSCGCSRAETVFA